MREIFVVCDPMAVDPAPEDRIWTISVNPKIPGWNTDGGHHGYGLTKADAEEIARAFNNERIDDLTEALQSISQWADAYPLPIFPEPDLAKAAKLLNDGGITLDAISAHCMRHVIAGVGAIAKKALGEQ